MSNTISSTDVASPGQRTYRAYHLNANGIVRRAEVVSAQSDDEARVIAAMLVNGCGIELWERARFLGRYPPLQHTPTVE